MIYSIKEVADMMNVEPSTLRYYDTKQNRMYDNLKISDILKLYKIIKISHFSPYIRFLHRFKLNCSTSGHKSKE